MIIDSSIENLLYYAQAHLLLDDLDVIYVRNLIMDELRLASYTQYEVDTDALDALDRPDTVIDPIVNYAVENGIITDDKRDYFSGKIMNLLCLRPSEVTDMFNDLHDASPVKAFDWLYDYGVKSDYVKLTKINNNKHWEAKGTKGKLEITINTSRPEKNNKETAKLLEVASSTYPSCTICKENEGFARGGQIRQTLRTIPITLGGEEWFWQYSPYAYFNHHGIAVNGEHVPMKVDASTLKKLFDFVDFMPNYMIGCNAALPGVGGSILTHDHFQGGAKLMPMQKAADKQKLKSDEYPYIEASVIDWYNSALRFVCSNREKLLEFAVKLNDAWKDYSDESVGVIAKTDKQHNAITPIVRKVSDGKYCLEVILRNNRADETYPDGIFHAHPEYQNIKSESIGLIEAMGLFILPGRLARQLEEIKKYIIKENKYSAAKLESDMLIHQTMIEKLIKEAGSAKLSGIEAELNIKDEIGKVCEGILENTAVFKKDEPGEKAFAKFIESLGLRFLA